LNGRKNCKSFSGTTFLNPKLLPNFPRGRRLLDARGEA
jgi:hypothetical protein